MLAHLREEVTTLTPRDKRALRPVLKSSRASESAQEACSRPSAASATSVSSRASKGRQPHRPRATPEPRSRTRQEQSSIACKAMADLSDSPSDEALHRARIKGKRARYAAELEPARQGDDQARRAGEAVPGRRRRAPGRRRGGGTDPRARHRLAGLVALAAGSSSAGQAERRRRASDRLPKAWARLEQAAAKAWPESHRSLGRRSRLEAGGARCRGAAHPQALLPGLELPERKGEEGRNRRGLCVRWRRDGIALHAVGPELAGTTYRDARGRKKHVRYWAMELPEGAEAAAGDGVDEGLAAAPGSGGATDLGTGRSGTAVAAGAGMTLLLIRVRGATPITGRGTIDSVRWTRKAAARPRRSFPSWPISTSAGSSRAPICVASRRSSRSPGRASWSLRSTTRSAPTASTTSCPSSTGLRGQNAAVCTHGDLAWLGNRPFKKGSVCGARRRRAGPLPASAGLGGFCRGPVEQSRAAPSRRPARATTNGTPSLRCASVSTMAPAASVSARQGSRPQPAASSTDERRQRASGPGQISRSTSGPRGAAVHARSSGRQSGARKRGASPRSNGRLRSRRRQPRRAEADRVRSSAGRASENRCRAT